MPIMPPARPQKGQLISPDFFPDLYDYVMSITPHGDLNTTTVNRTNSGSTITANVKSSAPSGQRSYAYIAKITADNDDGTYDADEQENDAGTFQANTDEGIEFGSATNDIGYLYELNGLRGTPVGTFVVVYKVADISGDPIWYFDGQQVAYGVDASGAWVEITAHSAGAYSWKQKNANATTDTAPAVTGALNAWTVNQTEKIPNGTIVWLRFDGTDYRFEYDRLNFWAKITGESSGSYSWTELEGDASTATARTGTTNAAEVSGRLGIPTNSIVYMVPHQTDDVTYRFEYHGANSGTVDALLYSSQLAAHTDTWERDDQGATRGERDQFMTRLFADTSTGEISEYTRRQTCDANGHRTAVNAETSRVVFVGTPSTSTYEFVDCATGLTTVARFDVADLPTDDYCWIHDGTDFVKSYNDGISAGAATSPVPCVVYMPTTPANCGIVDFSAFDDTFGDSSIDSCTLSDGSSGAGSISETGGAVEMICTDSGSAGVGRLLSFSPLSGDFSVSIDFSSLSVTYDNTGTQSTSSFGVFEFETTIGGTAYAIVVGSSFTALDGQNQGTWTRDGSTYTHYDTSQPSSGALEIARAGTTLTLKRGATTLDTITVSTAAPSFATGSIAATLNATQQSGDGDATLNLLNINFTGG